MELFITSKAKYMGTSPEAKIHGEALFPQTQSNKEQSKLRLS